MKRPVVAAVLSAYATLSCKKPPEPTGSQSPFLEAPKPSAAAPAPTAAPPPKQTALPPVQITWVDPPEWKRSTRPNPMRKATYIVPRASGDTEDGELAVSYFGPGQGGSIDANVERWVKQFKDVPADGVHREDREANGMVMHVVRVDSGTFNANIMGHGGEKLKKAYGLLGAIVEAPSGVYFFKLTGPKKTVAGAKKQFDALLASVKPA